jgi:hypothetical protein
MSHLSHENRATIDLSNRPAMSKPTPAPFEFLSISAIIQSILIGKTNILQGFSSQSLYEIAQLSLLRRDDRAHRKPHLERKDHFPEWQILHTSCEQWGEFSAWGSEGIG